MTLHAANISKDTSDQRPIIASSAGTISGPYCLFFKRSLDVVLVLLSAPIVLPLVFILACLIALTGNIPFYSQLRVGRGGVPFRMWKLRTMVKDADKCLESYLKNNDEARCEWESCQKLKNDPRITLVGRVLRKTSVDELPQLFNVLNGTMSLVGPRPMMVDQEQYYFGKAYYDMRPGVTGLWQVSDRNNCAFSDRVTYDNTYSREISLKTDTTLLLKTAAVVWCATGH